MIRRCGVYFPSIFCPHKFLWKRCVHLVFICPFYERVIWPSQHLNNLPEVTQLVRDGSRRWTQHCLIASGFSGLCACCCLWSPVPVSVQPGLLQHPHLLNPRTEGRWRHGLFVYDRCFLVQEAQENESRKWNLRSSPKPELLGQFNFSNYVEWDFPQC